MKRHFKIVFWMLAVLAISSAWYGAMAAIGAVKIESPWWYLFYSASFFLLTCLAAAACLEKEE